jgi:hypothetical protein
MSDSERMNSFDVPVIAGPFSGRHVEVGEIFLYPRHRAFQPIADLLLGLAGIGHGAVAADPEGRGEINPGDYVSLSGRHLDLTLRLPVGSAFPHVMNSIEPEIIGIGVREGRGFDGSNWAPALCRWMRAAFWPPFLAFYETHRNDWVQRNSAPPNSNNACVDARRKMSHK